MALNGGLPLGNFLAGLAADVWGVPVVLRALGVTLVAGAALLTLLLGSAARLPYTNSGSEDDKVTR
jgi:hypothetical protein